jgi:hypothetical protein
VTPVDAAAVAAADYCRAIEHHICQKNDGHLIRIVGPAFEVVSAWERDGVPLKVALRGIDRYFERYYAKGPRRRPVRVEFCEADVLDVFDDWRRSVGVSAGTEDTGGAPLAGPREPSGSLPAHLERIIARLTALRGGQQPSLDIRRLDALIDAVVRELDAVRAKARTIRGDARDSLLDRLRELDVSLIDAVRAQCDTPLLQQLAVDADEELRTFRNRMPSDAYQQSHRACIDRLLRERFRLPTISYE